MTFNSDPDRKFHFAVRQLCVPGTGPDIGGLLRLKASAPIKPQKPQKPCDVGLFSDEADQLDLVEMFQTEEN